MGTDGCLDALRMPPEVLEALIRDCRARAPEEACGVLIGRGRRAETVVPLPNSDGSALTYLADPGELFKIIREARGRGRKLVGIYHSHPATEAYPSATDVELAFYPEAFYVIASLADPAGPQIHAFRIREGRVTEAVIEVATAAGPECPAARPPHRLSAAQSE